MKNIFSAKPTDAVLRKYARILGVTLEAAKKSKSRKVRRKSVAEATNIMIVLPRGSLPIKPDDGKMSFERSVRAEEPDTAGHTLYTLGIASSLAKYNRQVTILGQRFGNAPQVLKWKDGVRIIRIPADGIWAKKLPPREYDWKPLRRRLKRFSSNAVAIAQLIGAQVVMGSYSFGGIIAAEIAVQQKIPMIFVPHVVGVETMLSDQFSNKRLFIDEAAALSAANFVIAASPQEILRIREYYKMSMPHYAELSPGISDVFYKAQEEKPSASIIARPPVRRHGLQEKKFFITWGPISVARNYHKQVDLLASLKKQFPDRYGDFKLVIVGGNPNHPKGKALEVETNLREVYENYVKAGILRGGDVVRIGRMKPHRRAALASQALAYLGTQTHKTFDLPPAENLAIGHSLTIVSKDAKIADRLRLFSAGLVLDFDYSDESARRINEVFSSQGDIVDSLIDRGRRFADSFKWEGIAGLQAAYLDSLMFNPLAESYRPLYYRTWSEWHGRFRKLGKNLESLSKDAFDIIFRWSERFESLNEKSRLLISFTGTQAKEIADYMAHSFSDNNFAVQRIPGELLREVNESCIDTLRNPDIERCSIRPGEADIFLGGRKAVLIDLPSVDESSELLSRADIRVSVGDDEQEYLEVSHIHLNADLSRVVINSVPILRPMPATFTLV